MQARIFQQFLLHGIDTSQDEVYYSGKAFDAIMDPMPIFLRNTKGKKAIAGFRNNYPDKHSEQIGRNVAAKKPAPVLLNIIF